MITGILLGASVVLLALFSLYITNDRRSALAVAISLLKSIAISAVALYIIYASGRIVLNNRYYFILWLPFLLTFFNLLMTNLEYGRLKKEKGFDIDFVSRYHFDQSLQTGLTISIITLVVFAFIPKELSFIIAIFSLLCILNLSFTHFVVRKILKDR
jgi:hypothetical protein